MPEAEMALAATAPPVPVPGDVLGVLPDALDLVPADALPVLTATWALSRSHPRGRTRFLRRLEDAAHGRPMAWVSAEGVGVAPAVPTLGDRRASGHSIIGPAVVDRTGPHAGAVGRCRSRGRQLSWLAGA